MTVRRTDRRLGREVGAILRLGVLVSSAVIVLGLVPYLVRDGARHVDYHMFRGEPAVFRAIPDLLAYAGWAHPRGIMQLGVLLLIATPFARVALCLVEFARERDRLYIGVTLVVLLTLSWGLFGAS
ncbi:MAG TPA: DUF1634 domain-containing protein [Thermoanaerobaculia bacterium]|nr:DUF1634 domain-containing protein [Thermoanaerobaculia bacterium]